MRKELFLTVLPSVVLAVDPALIFRRQLVEVPCSENGLKDCGDGCIDLNWTCCAGGDGGCPPTQYCTIDSNGKTACCPNGQVCEGPGGVNTDTIINTLTNTRTNTLPGTTNTLTNTLPGTTNTLTNTLTGTRSTSTSTSEKTSTHKSSSTSTNWGYTTSTVYATTTKTITSCAATVTNCPAHSTVVVTETIAVSTTVCPITGIPSYTSKPGSYNTTYYPPPSYTTPTTFYPTTAKNYTATAATSAVVTAGAAESYGAGSTLQLFGALMAAVMMF